MMCVNVQAYSCETSTIGVTGTCRSCACGADVRRIMSRDVKAFAMPWPEPIAGGPTSTQHGNMQERSFAPSMTFIQNHAGGSWKSHTTECPHVAALQAACQ